MQALGLGFLRPSRSGRARSRCSVAGACDRRVSTAARRIAATPRRARRRPRPREAVMTVTAAELQSVEVAPNRHDQRLDIRLAGSDHLARGRRLPRCRSQRRCRRSREARPDARRAVHGASRGRGRDEASDAQPARSAARQRAGGARARRSRFRDELYFRSPTRQAEVRRARSRAGVESARADLRSLDCCD